MNALTSEWLEKAEGDYATATRELRVRKAPNYDAVCFHAQQCAEKYLKALLQETDISFGRTHHLPQLLDLVLPHHPGGERLRTELQVLGSYAVNVRYPGDRANKEMAREAWAICRMVRTWARAALGLPD